MSQPITVVDAFSDEPFGGNPAAVCVLAAATTSAWMQAVAAEMNLSETAFVVPRPDGDADLRWFTPATEIALCGHATLAATHVLGRSARFHTRSGVLACRPAGDGAIEMDFPAIPVAPVADPPDWAGALGLAGDAAGDPAGPGPVAGVWAGGGWALVELADPADVLRARPDRAAVVANGGSVIVVAAGGAMPGSGRAVDSVCRVFVPGAGIDEDPVTGAAHCAIGPWLASRTGRTELTGYQASARGGTVGMRVVDDRVVLRGRAVTVLEATLHSDPPPAGDS